MSSHVSSLPKSVSVSQKRGVIGVLLLSGSYTRRAVLATVYSILNKIFDIAPEILIGIAVDTVVKRENSFISRLGVSDLRHQLFFLGAVTFCIWVGESLFQYLYSIQWRNLAQSVQDELRNTVYNHVQHLGLPFFERQSTGNLLATLNDDVNQLERFLDIGANQIIQMVVSTVVIGGVFFYISTQIAVLAFLPVPFIIFGGFYFQRRLAPLYLKIREKAALINAALANNLLGIMTIKSFTAEAIEFAKIEQRSADYRDSNRATIQVSSAFTPVIRIVILAGFLCTLVLGGIKTLDGEINIGLYSVLIFLTQRLLWPLTTLGETADQFERSNASANRVLSLLAESNGKEFASGKQELNPTAKAKIEFTGVSFGYRSDIPALRGLDFTILGGTTLGVVGGTGAGKSTLIKLLLKFYEPSSGKITIDGISLGDLDTVSVRRAIGFVSQEPYLFGGTIEENIVYGCKGATVGAAEEVAHQAEILHFIRALPEGFQTEVGERGVKLSGGQKQRIAIARALIKDPRILILDEATSAVDNETEKAIQTSLGKITRGRTTIIIAHRLSTVRHADKIIVLDQGKIVESGTHDQLVALNGRYTSLWQIQTGERV